MTFKSSICILGIILCSSCNNSKTQSETQDTTSATIKLTDSSRAKLINALDTLVTSNSRPDDITISAKFINQGKYDNGDSYITVKTKNDSLVTLINPMPLSESDIVLLKKDGDNITLTYSSSDKTVKFLAADYEPKK